MYSSENVSATICLLVTVSKNLIFILFEKSSKTCHKPPLLKLFYHRETYSKNASPRTEVYMKFSDPLIRSGLRSCRVQKNRSFRVYFKSGNIPYNYKMHIKNYSRKIVFA
jgi:hypothetical protein